MPCSPVSDSESAERGLRTASHGEGNVVEAGDQGTYPGIVRVETLTGPTERKAAGQRTKCVIMSHLRDW